MLEIVLNVQKYTELRFTNLYSHGKGVNGNLTKKYFDGKHIKYPDVHTKLYFLG